MSSPRVIASSALVAASVLTMVPTPAAAAVAGSVDQLPFPDFAPNEFVDEHFSSDLSTAVFTQDVNPLVGDPAPNAGFTTVIDLSTGELRLIQPDRGPSDQRPAQLDGDGSHLLVAANWEGVVTNDADDGAFDLFVTKTDVDDVIALTAGLTAEEFEPIGMSDDARTVVFASSDTDGVQTLHLWQDDVVTDIPTVGVVDTFEPNALSSDGTTVFYSTVIDAEVTWHAHDLASGTEHTIIGTSVFDVSVGISNDGSVIAATEVDDDPATHAAVVWRTNETELITVAVPGRQAILSGDGSTLYGTASRSDDDVEVKSVWRLDIDAGEVDTILESRQRVRGVVAVSDDGASVVLHAAPSSVGQRPITFDFFAEEIEQFFLVDLSAVPAPTPVPGYSGTLDDQLIRLYDAFFDRAPDAGGLEFWRNQRAQGQGLFDVSAEFAASPEFVATYGDLDDDAFIDLVYGNVLDRAPDDAGKAFWLDQLDTGRERGTVMALFSDSPEFIDSTGTLAPESAIAASVRRLYAGYFARSADPVGLAFWIDQAEQGMSLEAISESFRTSVEFIAVYDVTTGVVDDAYSIALVGFGNTLGVLDENAAFDFSVAEQDGDISLAEVMISITNAPEFVAVTSTTPIAD